MGPFEEQLFGEASQENSHQARARMIRAEGIRVPGSKATSFFRTFYRIPCVGFSPFGWERELVYYCLLENCGTTVFLHLCTSFRLRELYRDKSNNELVVIGTAAIDIEVCSRVSR